ncbi:hypothetical protein [Agaribacter marinus]|uniref:Lipoprotein n=1 Tax=Agaribacter marinus TaxID=1431249 RepID=A0AA37WKU6_9ALTE|nr:hypothetical protein [Agaribacter marinus]GLR71240.1 hypothetical protein GCM10007852_21480 [Agaribacter marinus]
MRFLFFFTLLLLISGCDDLTQESLRGDIKVLIELDSESSVQLLTFGDEPVKSCFFEGDVLGGSAKDTETNEEVKIGYLVQNNSLRIEIYPGLCDGGFEMILTKKMEFLLVKYSLDLFLGTRILAQLRK